jgi:hypothetical protein
MMANGPNDYQDPKVTTTDRGGAMKWLWWILGAIVVLLLLSWLLGLFATDDVAEVESDDAVIVEDGAAVVEEPAAAGDAAEDGATEGAGD